MPILSPFRIFHRKFRQQIFIGFAQVGSEQQIGTAAPRLPERFFAPPAYHLALPRRGDFARIEIKNGLSRDCGSVIPVLVDNAAILRADLMPINLRELTFKNAVHVFWKRQCLTVLMTLSLFDPGLSLTSPPGPLSNTWRGGEKRILKSPLHAMGRGFRGGVNA